MALQDDLKRCRYCGLLKPESEFVLRMNRCKKCHGSIKQARYYASKREIQELEQAYDSTNTERAYAAGIIDGEGSISVHRRVNPKGQYNYSILVEVKMTGVEVLLWMLSVFGGNYGRARRRNVPLYWKPIYRWYVAGQTAAVFLELIIPYMQLKQRRAQLAQKLASLSRSTVRLGGRGNAPLTLEGRAERENLAFQIRAENRRSSSAANATSEWGPN